MKILSRLALLLASLALSFAVGELFLRALDPPVDVAVFVPGEQRIFESKRGSLPGVSGPARFTINAWGIRGPDFGADDEYRVLAVGGSTTECAVLDDDETWTSLLQAGLSERFPDRRFWVGSVGRSGHSTRDHRLQVEALLARYPRIDAILLLAGGNDFLNRLRAGWLYTPLSTKSSAYRAGLLHHAFAIHPSFEQPELRIVRRGKQLRNRLNSREQRTEQYANLVVLGRTWRKRAPRIDALPDLEAPLAEYRSNLAAIRASASRHGVRLIAMTQPALWHAELSEELQALLWLGGEREFPKGKRYLSVAALAEGMRRYNEALLAFCEAHAVECVDLAAQLAKDASVFYDDVHFNESGARQVSRILVDYMATTPPLSRAEATLRRPRAGEYAIRSAKSPHDAAARIAVSPEPHNRVQRLRSARRPLRSSR